MAKVQDLQVKARDERRQMETDNDLPLEILVQKVVFYQPTNIKNTVKKSLDATVDKVKMVEHPKGILITGNLDSTGKPLKRVIPLNNIFEFDLV